MDAEFREQDSISSAGQTVQDAGQPKGASRGEFLKWGTIAVSGLYVGPRITSFAVNSSLGHAGSVPVSPTPTPITPIYPTTPIYPATGGAANLTPAQRRALRNIKR